MMPNNNPLVVTIIVHYQSPEECATLVSDLEQLSYPNHQIVVVDNQSATSYYQQLTDLLQPTQAILIQNKANNGYGAGINLGVEHTLQLNPFYYHIINCDTRILNKDYISSIIQYMEKDEQLALIGPGILMEGKIVQNTIMPFISLYNVFAFKRLHKENSKIELIPQLYPADVINGVCFMVSAKAFKDINGFDKDYFMYGEEHDFCYNLHKKGYKCMFWSGQSILHYNGHKPNKKAIHWRDVLVRCNQILYLKKHNKQFSSIVLSILFCLSFCIKRVLGIKFIDFTISQVIYFCFNPMKLNKYFINK